MKKAILCFIFSILLLGIVYADWFDLLGNPYLKYNKIKIVSSPPDYMLTKCTGIECDLYEPVIDKENNKLILKLKDGKDDSKSKLIVYKSKDKSVTEEVNKVKDGDKDKYEITLSHYIQIGENTIIVEFVGAEVVMFKLDSNNNISAYCNRIESNTTVRVPLTYSVNETTNKWKWGLNDTNCGGFCEYECLITSNMQAYQKGFKTENKRIDIDDSDFCSHENASCTYETGDNTVTLRGWNSGFFDPTYTITTTYANVLTINTTYQTTINVTHTKISNVAPYDSLVAYFPFDVDILYTKQFWTSCKVGNCIQFDGTTDKRIEIANSQHYINWSNDWSLSGWMNPNSAVSIGHIIGTGKTFGASRTQIAIIGSTSGIRVTMINSTTGSNIYNANNFWVLGEWVHFGVIKNSTTLLIYRDGTLNLTYNLSGIANIDSGETEVHIGAQNTISEFSGLIDEIKLWNRTITDIEMLNTYTNESIGQANPYLNTTGLVLNMPLNNTQSTRTEDISGIQGNGTLIFSSLAYDFAGSNDATYSDNTYSSSDGIYRDVAVFDGVNDDITIPAATSLNNLLGNASVSVWFNLAHNTSDKAFYWGNSGTWYVQFVSGGALRWTSGGGLTIVTCQSDSLGIPINTWHHAVFTSSDTNLSIYYDGNLLKTCAGTINGTSSSIKKIGSTSSRYMNGSIDEFMIFNSTLTLSQIQDIFNNQSQRFYYHGENVYPGKQDDSNRANVSFSGTLEKSFGSNISIKVATVNTNRTYYNTSLEGKGILTYVQFDNQTDNQDTASLANGLGNTSNLSVYGNPLAVSGYYGSAKQLDGSDDYMTSTQQFGNTITMRVKPTAIWDETNPDQHCTIISQYIECYAGEIHCGFQLSYSSTDFTSSGLSIYSGTGSGLINSTGSTYVTTMNQQWYHIALVAGKTVYLDGNNVVTGSDYDDYGGWTPTIGRESYVDTNYCGFEIDEVQVFNRQLTADEVKALAYCGNTNCLDSDSGAGIQVNTSANEWQDLVADTNLTFQTASSTHKVIMTNQSTGQYGFYTSILGAGTFTMNTYNVTEAEVGDTTPPSINFTFPTAANNSISTSLYVNVSSSDTNEHYTFLNLDNSLILWMRMDDVNGSGQPTDISGYGNNGTLINTTFINGTGKYKNASWFDGNDYININDWNQNWNNGISFFAWVNPINDSRIKGVWSDLLNTGLNGTYMSVDVTGTVSVRTANNTAGTTLITTQTIPFGNWTHVGFTYNNSNLSIYINGVISRSAIHTQILTDNNRVQAIGFFPFDNAKFFNGSIDEVLVFNRSLLPNEVKSLFNATVNQYQANFTGLAEGNHSYKAHANDIYGNRNETETRLIQLTEADTSDTTPPTINSFYQYGNTTYNITNLESSVYSYCNVTDNNASAVLNVSMQWKLSTESDWNDMNESLLYPYLIYAHGDSITAGNVWTTNLDGFMGSNLSAVNASNSSQKLYNKAISGWFCTQVDQEFNTVIPNNSVAAILCGINGYAQLTNMPIMENISIKAQQKNVSLIWISILTATNASIYVDTAIPSRLYTINEWLRTNLTVRYNSTFVDAHRRMYNGTYGFANASLFNADGLHPNTDGQAVLANVIWEQGFNRQKFGLYKANMTVPNNTTYRGKYLDFRCNASDGLQSSAYTTNLQSVYINDPCTYTSGDWNIDCSDNCIFTENVNLQKNNAYLTGTGTVTGKRYITNYTIRKVSDGCVVYT